jgi:hypothetical protein
MPSVVLARVIVAKTFIASAGAIAIEIECHYRQEERRLRFVVSHVGENARLFAEAVDVLGEEEDSLATRLPDRDSWSIHYGLGEAENGAPIHK